mmetsp:Transcript_61795/g.159426  ORF Transcript_61795/g.159426 Transcript_61795/m.159426 type:complete len:207 (-) Transcript_61795:440-1060(-)
MPYTPLHRRCCQTYLRCVSLCHWASCGCEGLMETQMGQGLAGQATELRGITRHVPVTGYAWAGTMARHMALQTTFPKNSLSKHGGPNAKRSKKYVPRPGQYSLQFVMQLRIALCRCMSRYAMSFCKWHDLATENPWPTICTGLVLRVQLHFTWHGFGRHSCVRDVLRMIFDRSSVSPLLSFVTMRQCDYCVCGCSVRHNHNQTTSP